jgi:hypothetical protein
VPRGPGDQDGDEIAAIELNRRAEASDVGNETIERLALAVDDRATAYPGTPPGGLLGRVRAHLGYVGQLLGARATLAQHRGLLVTGGWLSLLASTCLIDLHRDAAAAAHLRTAALARVEALGSPMPLPDRPEHHYRYDPAKSEAYVATTLAWLGDRAAEGYARHILARLESAADGPPRPRRRVLTCRSR